MSIRLLSILVDFVPVSEKLVRLSLIFGDFWVNFNKIRSIIFDFCEFLDRYSQISIDYRQNREYHNY